MNKAVKETQNPALGETRLHRAEVPGDCAGMRYDQVLARLFPDYSRSRLTEWIRDGSATLDGVAAKPAHLVTGGERIELAAKLTPKVADQPEAIALDVLYEDRQVLVVNKPAGLVVHPGAGNPGGTLQNALLHHDPKLQALPRAGIVHRLDRETSGALVVAKTLKAHAKLVELLAERDIHRQYVALVAGAIIAGATIDQPIDRHPRERLKMAVREGGREAITHYRVRERFKAHTLLEVRLETGRTHQIRVHLAHARHPIIGDPLYGGGLRLPKGASPELSEALRGFRRQALHAERLEFPHPVSGKAVVAEAPLPADMVALLAALRAG